MEVGNSMSEYGTIAGWGFDGEDARCTATTRFASLDAGSKGWEDQEAGLALVERRQVGFHPRRQFRQVESLGPRLITSTIR